MSNEIKIPEGFIPWDGKRSQPAVNGDLLASYVTRYNPMHIHVPNVIGELRWKHNPLMPSPGDIVGYKILG